MSKSIIHYFATKECPFKQFNARQIFFSDFFF